MLDNDGDDNGNNYDKSDIDITDITQPASKGTAVSFEDDDGVDKIRYTPNGDETGDDSFEYKAKFPDDTTDTATTTVDVTGDKSSCGPLTVRVEDQNEDLVNATFTPMYDTTNTSDGVLEPLPPKSGEWTYNVEVTDKPRLSEMNGELIDIPDGFATSVDEIKKDVEKTVTASGPQEEPDDFWYPLQERVRTKSKLATDPSGGDDTNTCTKTIPPSEWSGEPTSYSYAEDTDQPGDEKTSDGKTTATLDITNYLGSDDSLNSVSVGYTGAADCDSDAASCSASATTTVTFSNGSSTTVSKSADSNTDYRGYLDYYETLDDTVTSTKVINNSSASITRDVRNVEAHATGTLQATDINYETTGSCDGSSSVSGGGSSSSDGDTANTAPEAAHIYPEYSGNDLDQITLQGLAGDVDGDALTYGWYEGTETSGNPDGTGQSYSLGTKSCSYSQDWTLQVSDGDLTDTVTRTIEASSGCQSGGGPGNPDQPIQVE